MRPVLGLLAALALAGAAAPPPPAAAAVGARLQGTWQMTGRVTRADGVRGERRGQRVRRTWSFVSACSTGPCDSVLLTRERPHQQTDSVVLRRLAAGIYAGRGRFFVALRCGGRTYPHGGVALMRIRLVVRAAAMVETTPFATAVSATYTNPRRVNRTPCAGSIGRDAGTYSGRLAGPLPSPPLADFTSTTDPVARTASFADASSSPSGAAIVRWSWDFGDPSSGGDDSSALQRPQHRYGTPGTYTVTLTVTDANGLTATIARQVVI